MNKMIPALILALCIHFSSPCRAQASAVASVYNGVSAQLAGYSLLQDAGDSNKFYWLPNGFNLVSGVKSVEVNGERQWKQKVEFSHAVQSKNGKEYSVYSFEVRLTAPGTRVLWAANSQLRRLVGPKAKVVGMAPVCSMSLALPSVTGSGPSLKNDLRISYGFLSSDKDRCDSTQFKDFFLIEIIVPMELEPLVASQIVAGSFMLPGVQLYHPYKYADTASLSVKIGDIYDELSGNTSISGSVWLVKAKVQERVFQALSRLSMSASVTYDIQSNDPQTRAHFEKLLTEGLADALYKYEATPVGSRESADGDGQESDDVNKLSGQLASASGKQPWKVTASLSRDKASISREKTVKIDLTKINYGSIRSEASISISGIKKELLDAKVEKLL